MTLGLIIDELHVFTKLGNVNLNNSLVLEADNDLSPVLCKNLPDLPFDANLLAQLNPLHG